MTCCSLFELTKQTLNNMQPIPTTKNIKKYICRCVTSAVGAAPACLYSSIRLPFPWRGVRRWVHLQLFQALAQILHSNGFVQSTVDGSEIRLASWGKGSLSHYLQDFIHSRWLFGISSINSAPVPECFTHTPPTLVARVVAARLPRSPCHP